MKSQALKQLFLRTNGLIRIRLEVRVADNYTLSFIYTPGVRHIYKVIQKDPDYSLIQLLQEILLLYQLIVQNSIYNVHQK